MQISLEYWQCLRAGQGLVLFLFVTGHEEGRSYLIEAGLSLSGTSIDLTLTTRSRLDDNPAAVEIEIDTEGLAPGKYDVAVTFDGNHVGTFPCEVN